MKQALHILKKDIREHWYEIAITLAVTLVFGVAGSVREAFSSSPYEGWSGGLRNLAAFLLPLTWWNLTARVIYSEALPGDRQFWLTRPYQRSSLLGAKLLFILLFISVPMLLAEAAIVVVYGVPIFAALPGLLWSQLLLTAAFILPVAALSTISRGFSQLLWAAIPAIIIVALAFGATWFELTWVRTYYLLTVTTIGALVIIMWQYARRRTTVARLLAVATIFVALVMFLVAPWTTAFQIQSRVSPARLDVSAVQVGGAAKDSWRTGDPAELPKIWLTIPLEIRGLPDGASAQPIGWTAQFQAPDGTTWKEDRLPWTNAYSDIQQPALHIDVDSTLYRRLARMPVTLRGTLYLTVFGKRESTDLVFRNRPFAIPGAGRCTLAFTTAGASNVVLCDSVFRSPKELVWVQSIDQYANANDDFAQTHFYSSGSPFPAELGFSPIRTATHFAGIGSRVEVNRLEPVAYIERSFELKDLHFEDSDHR